MGSALNLSCKVLNDYTDVMLWYIVKLSKNEEKSLIIVEELIRNNGHEQGVIFLKSKLTKTLKFPMKSS